MGLSESVKQVICDRWSLPAETTFEPTEQGSSNATYFVYTPDNQFVLKLYAATTETAQIHYEHSLLTFLQHTVPFAIPVPIRATCGNTLISIDVDGQLLNAALVPRLVGQPACRQNLKQVQAAGLALAQLHNQLVKFDPQGQLARLPFWGALDRIHPQVKEPLNIPQILHLGVSEQTRLSQMLNEAIAAAPDLYATLPIQTIHADYITPNILVENDRVVGVLDFEFATRDLRLFDYLSSLDQFASFPWKEVQFEDIIRAFSHGYQACSALTVAEMQATILVWKLQRVSALVYWTGRLITGKGSRQQLVNAVMETLRFETWLESNQQQLLDALSFT